MSESSIFKSITAAEIQILISNGCICDDWDKIEVKDGFNPFDFKNVHFSGKIKLGISDLINTDRSGVSLKSGISNSHIHNCVIGDNVSIHNTGNYIANYIIDDEVIIHNCGKIHTEGYSSFGNGTEVAVLNETGTRSVKIWDRLSSHLAYIIALYRHQPEAIIKIDQMIDDYVTTFRSEIGTIGRNSKIINCGQIRNVRIGPFSSIEGAIRVNEGSITSCKEDPSSIGPGVIMDHFILSSGSVVTDSTLVNKCFIGQGCYLGKHYSAENSLFFANCVGCHGEACSIFAGPYTVTHHKSTLLIAGIFSFMNAGSGSNQSNHMYKLGPVHQGILERGCKTSSGSYLLWPSVVGPFTLVIGKHSRNLDTSSFPFSYLTEINNESVLVPGINLKSAGTIRDAKKWPQRDNRKDPRLTDMINFDLLNPYTILKMISGRDLLKRLEEESGIEPESYSINNIKISRASLQRGIKLYQAGIDKFLGNSIIKRLESTDFRTSQELKTRLIPVSNKGTGDWIDLAGLIVPKTEVDILLERIKTDSFLTPIALEKEFENFYRSYNEWEWNWAAARIGEEAGKELSRFPAGDIIKIVERWKTSVTDLDNLVYDDARKEFSLLSMTGFGIDGGDEEKHLDFVQVRGEFESNPFVNEICVHKKQKSAIGDELIERLKRLK